MSTSQKSKRTRGTSSSRPQKGHYGNTDSDSDSEVSDEDMSPWSHLGLPREWPGSRATLTLGSMVVIQDKYTKGKTLCGISVSQVFSRTLLLVGCTGVR